ncbi:HlyD family efflux transporter periplasmic adaptor subunit [Flavobacteriaceae bacterium GF1]
MILCAGWFVKYPETISTKVYITTPLPPVDVIAKSNGSIVKLFGYSKNDTLQKGTPLILLQNNASFGQILALQEELLQKKTLVSNTGKNIETITWLDSLGNIQPIYNKYVLSILNFNDYQQNNPYGKRIAELEEIISISNRGIDYTKEYIKNSNNDYELENLELERFKKLYDRGVVSLSELEKIQQQVIRKKMQFSNDNKILVNEKISIAQLSKEILEIKILKTNLEKELSFQYQSIRNELQNQLEEWLDLYLIKSPIEGRPSYFENLNTGDFINNGQHLLTVIPTKEQRLFARGVVSSKNLGNVLPGNKVILKLDAYPYQEYGAINGSVSRISEIPFDNEYSIDIALTNNLETNYNKKIVFRQRLSATAEIITEEKSILRRLFFQIESLLKN